jgi:hypothetical protein
MSTTDLWTYRDQTILGTDLTDFSVEALDGSIGKIDDANFDVGGSFIVVNTGPWIFGRKVALPAGVIKDVDPDTQTVFVNRTKEQIKNAPEFDESRFGDEAYRSELAGHYGPGGAGYRDENV